MNARKNETKFLEYCNECWVDWEDIAKSLLGWLSDDEVRLWAEMDGYDDIFDED